LALGNARGRSIIAGVVTMRSLRLRLNLVE
jgi:hypothetical protein